MSSWRRDMPYVPPVNILKDILCLKHSIEHSENGDTNKYEALKRVYFDKYKRYPLRSATTKRLNYYETDFSDVEAPKIKNGRKSCSLQSKDIGKVKKITNRRHSVYIEKALGESSLQNDLTTTKKINRMQHSACTEKKLDEGSHKYELEKSQPPKSIAKRRFSEKDVLRCSACSHEINDLKCYERTTIEKDLRETYSNNTSRNDDCNKNTVQREKFENLFKKKCDPFKRENNSSYLKNKTKTNKNSENKNFKTGNNEDKKQVCVKLQSFRIVENQPRKDYKGIDTKQSKNSFGNLYKNNKTTKNKNAVAEEKIRIFSTKDTKFNGNHKSINCPSCKIKNGCKEQRDIKKKPSGDVNKHFSKKIEQKGHKVSKREEKDVNRQTECPFKHISSKNIKNELKAQKENRVFTGKKNDLKKQSSGKHHSSKEREKTYHRNATENKNSMQYLKRKDNCKISMREYETKTGILKKQQSDEARHHLLKVTEGKNIDKAVKQLKKAEHEFNGAVKKLKKSKKEANNSLQKIIIHSKESKSKLIELNKIKSKSNPICEEKRCAKEHDHKSHLNRKRKISETTKKEYSKEGYKDSKKKESDSNIHKKLRIDSSSHTKRCNDDKQKKISKKHENNTDGLKIRSERNDKSNYNKTSEENGGPKKANDGFGRDSEQYEQDTRDSTDFRREKNNTGTSENKKYNPQKVPEDAKKGKNIEDELKMLFGTDSSESEGSQSPCNAKRNSYEIDVPEESIMDTGNVLNRSLPSSDVSVEGNYADVSNSEDEIGVEENNTETSHDSFQQPSTSTGSQETLNDEGGKMTKNMEHFKKRLIHQLERPTVPDNISVKEVEISAASPVSSCSSVHSNDSNVERKKDEVVRSKVARKRGVCRSQFRHKEIEIFKMGMSPQTSLRQTKEPYKASLDKTPPANTENQHNGKKGVESILRESSTESNSNGPKKDFSRSLSLNDKVEKVSNVNHNNTINSVKNMGNGRHNLPAIIAQIPERRKSISLSTPRTQQIVLGGEERMPRISQTDEGDALEMQQVMPASINNRKIVSKRRRTISVEQNIRNDENDSLEYETRRSETPASLPINLSAKGNPTETSKALNLNSKDAQLDLSKRLFLEQVIPKEPNNTPKKPHPLKNYTPSGSLQNVENSVQTFPGIHQQMTRLQSSAVPEQNHPNRQKRETKNVHTEIQQLILSRQHQQTQQTQHHYHLSQEAQQQVSVIEEVDRRVKSIIRHVHSIISDPNFTSEILIQMNISYLELKYLIKPSELHARMLSVAVRKCISDALKNIELYVAARLFDILSKTKSADYTRKMLQIELKTRKFFLDKYLHLVKVKCNDDAWMYEFLERLKRNDFSFEYMNCTPFINVNPVISSSENHLTQPGSNSTASVTSQLHTYPPQNLLYNVPLVESLYGRPKNYFPLPTPYERMPQGPRSHTVPPKVHTDVYLQQMLPPYGNNLMMNPGINPNVPKYHKNMGQTLPHFNIRNVPDATITTLRPDLADNRCVPPTVNINTNPPYDYYPVSRTNDDRIHSQSVPSLPNNTERNQEVAIPTSRQVIQYNNSAQQNVKKTQMNRQEIPVPPVNNNAAPPTTTASLADVEELLQTNVIVNKNIMNVEPNKSVADQENLEVNNNNARLPQRNFAINVNISNNNSVIIQENLRTPTETNAISDIIISKNVTSVENIQERNTSLSEITKNNDNIPKDRPAELERLEEVSVNRIESTRSVSDTVIVKDNSMEVTISTNDESTENKRLENPNDVTVELVQNNIPPASASTDVIDITDSTEMDIKEDLKFSDLPQWSRKLRERLNLGTEITSEKLQLVKKILKESFKEQYGYLVYMLSKTKCEVKTEADEVILIDDDEDISVVKVIEMSKSPTPFEITSPKRKTEEDCDQLEKKFKLELKPTINLSDSNEVVVIEDEEKEKVDKCDKALAKDNNVSTIPSPSQIVITPVSTNTVSNSPILTQPASEKTNESSIISDVRSGNNTDTTLIMESSEVDVCKSGNNTNTTLIMESSQVDVCNSTPTPTPDLEQTKKSLADVKSLPTKITDSKESAASKPAIEDISSDEEIRDNVHLTSTYDSQISNNARNMLGNTEISYCTQVDKPEHHFEKPLVFTKAVMSRQLSREDPSLMSIVDNRAVRFSPEIVNPDKPIPRSNHGYQINVTPPHHLEHYSRLSPITPPSSAISPKFASPTRVVNISPVIPMSPGSPLVSMSPVKQVPSPRVNWKNLFTDEQKKDFLSFERSQSVESETISRRQSVETVSSVGSDYCPKYSIEDNYFEIKIDTKVYSVTKNVYDKIPKGKLCYFRQSNKLFRYFDTRQMELFLINLSDSEKSDVLKESSDLQKQIKSRYEGVPPGPYVDSEVVYISKDVKFSTEDYISDPELYIVEINKVSQFVPTDFFGFYKFVTGYQIINNHPPISFQTFLTMHNTSGLKTLLHKYVVTLIKGRTVTSF